jgi:hypothetical protein
VTVIEVSLVGCEKKRSSIATMDDVETNCLERLSDKNGSVYQHEISRRLYEL